MRRILLCILPCLATVGSAEASGPRVALPRGVQLKVLPLPWWNSAEKARVGALLAVEEPATDRGRPRVDVPFLPYPQQVPGRHRGILVSR